MKKLTALLIALFLAIPAQAAVNRTVIASTLLDNSPTTVSGTIRAADTLKSSFFVSYDETEVGGGVSVTVTLYASYDGTNFVQLPFYDTAGGATPQTSEVISADGWYHFWIDQAIAAPYYKVTIAGTNTDADDTASVACYQNALQ